MGSGKKKIEIKKIERETRRMVTFSKRRKGLFKKADELRSKTGANLAILVISASGKPYPYGDVDAIDAALNARFDSNSSGSRSRYDVMNGASSTNGVSGATSSVIGNNLRGWLKNIDIEGCNKLDELLLLKEELEMAKERIITAMDFKEFDSWLLLS